MEVKRNYKLSEVGVIPKEWDVRSLGSLFSFSNGVNADKSSYGNGRRFINVLEPITFSHLHGPEIPGRVVIPDAVAEAYAVKAGDVVFNRTSETDIELGLAATYMGSEHVVFGGFVIRGRPTDDSLDPTYSGYALRAPVIRSQIIPMGQGAVRANIGQQSLKRVLAPVPPLSEQRAIAAALRDTDALLTRLDLLISKKRNLKQAAMQQLLTGQTRLKGFGSSKGFKASTYARVPEDWDVKPFKQVSSMNGRIGWQGLKQGEFTENLDDPYLITGMNFKDGKIRWDEVYHIPSRRYHEAPAIQLQPHDVLMTKDGTIGKLLYVDSIPYPGVASINSHLLVFRPLKGQYVPKFLFYQLASPTFAQHIELHKSGSTFFGLTQEATGKYPVVLPSIPEQRAIAEVLSDIDAELDILEQRRDKTSALKQGMMQELLTGRTRLI